MHVFDEFKKEVIQMLSDSYGGDVASTLIYPQQRAFGEISSNFAFKLKSNLSQNPITIADNFANNHKNGKYVSKVEAKSGYVNFFIDQKLFLDDVSKESSLANYGSSKEGSNKKIIIDYSSPNIAKPFGVSHLRSTAIGDSLSMCYSFLGYSCERINYLGDWGTQFGKLMEAYLLWGDVNRLKADPLEESLALYIKFNKQAESDPTLEDKARLWFKKLEDQDPKALEMWNIFRNYSIDYFKRIYSLMGVTFDSIEGESAYAKGEHTNKVLSNLAALNLSSSDQDGSIIINLDAYNLGTTILQKKDGSTLYILRDIAAAIDRNERYAFKKSIYVVGADQNLHFKQLFKILELMGYQWAKDCVHVEFGLITIDKKKMSTRKGKIVLLEDILKSSIDQVDIIIKNRDKKPTSDVKKISSIVGIGAVKFAIISHERKHTVEFNMERILDFNGDTGPYLQYAFARASKLLGGATHNDKKLSILSEIEKDLLYKIFQFPEIIKKAAYQYQINAISSYLIELTHLFSAFYESCPVNSDAIAPSERLSRLLIVECFSNTLKNGLMLLGINVMEEM